jgi:diadenosine tetraphosphate (Ap4A) HIT family hydrolase
MQNKILFPNENIITTKLFVINQDWEIPISGFFIIAPLRKINSIDELTDEEAIEFINLLRYLRKGMREILKIEEIYLFQNEDSEHGFHLWVFPRHKWMKKFGNKIQSVRPIIVYAKENMLSQKTINEVKDSVKIMREFMRNFPNQKV